MLQYYVPPRAVAEAREETDARICAFLIACTIISFPGLCLLGGMMMGGGMIVVAGIQASIAGSTTGFALVAQRYRTRIGAAADQRVDAAFGLGAMVLAFSLIPLLVFASWVLLSG